MGTIRRQSIKSTIYIYAGVLIGFLYTGILMPKFLTEAEIGALNLIVAYSLIFAQLGSLGFNIATIRFFPYFQDKKKAHHGFLFLSLLTGGMGFILVSIIYYLFKPVLMAHNLESSPIFTGYFFLILPVSFFMIFFNLFDSYARALYFSTIGTFLNEFFKRILILGVVLFFIFNLISRDALFFLYSAAVSLPAIAIILFLLYKKEFFLVPDFSLLNKGFRKEMASVSILGLITGFSVLAIAQIDRLMVNGFINEAATGVYSVTFYFGTLVLLPSRALLRIAPSFVAKAFKDNNLQSVDDIYRKSCLNQFILSLLLFLILWLNIGNIFKIISPDYIEGKYVIFYIGIANVINMAGGVSGSIIANSKYYYFNAIFISVFLVIIVISNYYLIPTLGIKGAALASALSTLIFNLIKFLFIREKFGFQPYNYKYLVLMLFSLLIIGIVNLIPDIKNLYISLVVISGISTVLFISLVYFTKISRDFNRMIDDNIRRVLP